MYGNDLISYFGKKEKKQGFLNLEDLDCYTFKTDPHYGTRKIEIDGKDYFMKDIFNKDRISAEILCGILYNKMGTKSAMYLPMYFEDERYVISNNVLDKDCMSIEEYLKTLEKVYNYGHVNPFLFSDKYSYVPLENRLDVVTLDCLRENLKINAIDLALGNWDGRNSNRGIKMVDRKATEMRVFDNEASGWKWGFERDLIFYNNFAVARLIHDDVINHYRTNEEYRQYITPQELAEVVGSLPIDESVNEATQATGHQFNQEYIDYLKYNVDKTAQELEQC